MQEVFRKREETVVAPEVTEAPVSVSTQKSDELAGHEKKMQDEPTEDEKDIDVWEGLNRRKFVTDYFNTEQFEHEFGVKMQTSKIDKYIKAELSKREFSKTTDNYKSILAEIESEIGSSRMETFSRLKKIVGYIQVINKMNSLKEKKKLYQSLTE